MNICITNYDSNPQFIGGIKRVSSILAKEWIKSNNVYFLGISPVDNQIKEICGIPQTHMPVPGEINSDKNLDFFIRFVNENKIDIILHQHSDNLSFTELCINVKKQTGIKLITTRHFAISHNEDITKHAFFIKYKLQKSPIAWLKDFLFFIKYYIYKGKCNIISENRFYKYLISNSDKFVLLSDSFVEELKKRLDLTEAEKYKICAINNPIELVEHKITPKKKRVLWCGRVEFGTKRVDRILEIWKRITPKHPDWELYIMGSGNIGYFKAITQKYNIPNVVFTGSCNPYDYYKEGSILCMTSSAESWGMVLVEAQMFGCIPIAYDSYSSLGEIITDNVNGFKIAPFNKKQYAKRLEWLMENEDERNKMFEECQQSVKRFDVSIIAKQWMELFKNLISEHKIKCSF